MNNILSFFPVRIDLGSPEIDRKINHAYSLFSQENSSIEDKRSACEELSFVLEPFREDLSMYFSKKDVNHFFDLVNNFDIRHNRETTKKLVFVEQVEWVFFGLLNTILTYGKLKKRNI